MSESFETLLEKYANLIVHVGLNIQPGQRLIIRAPIEAAALVRAVVAYAYRAGSPYVEVFYGDEALILARYQYAPRDSFEEYPMWRIKGMEELMRGGAASLSVYAEDPDLLKDQDPELIRIVQTSAMKHSHTVKELITADKVAWSVVSMPVPAWAARVFPDLPAEEQMARLWQAIFETTRVNTPDPVAAWQEHIAELTARCDYLNNKRYTALTYRGPGTELRVGLPDAHVWQGGAAKLENGVSFAPNMPTEEIFTLPHKDRVDGVVSASLPLSYAGKLIKDFQLTFQDGKVVAHSAAQGQEVLGQILDTDAGSRRLGEVALVPASSPVAKSGLLFYNTLFDENAASHLALGQAYQTSLAGGDRLSPEEFARAGGNASMIHEDFMIGSAQMDVDGVNQDGNTEPLMRNGEWVF